jgi:hypothetical protein
MFEQFVKGGADSAFVFDAQPGEFGERIVISGYGLVRGLEGQARRGGVLQERRHLSYPELF